MSIKSNFIRRLRPVVRLWRQSLDERKMASLLNQQLPTCNIGRGHLVLDLGANRGRFSRMAAKKGATVFAFEPLSVAANVAEKGLKRFPNTYVFRAAVTDHSGIIDLYEHANAATDQLGFSISASTVSTKPNISTDNPKKVLSVALSDILDTVQRVDLLKVDIEGGELAVWPTIRDNAHKINFLLMELHDFSPALLALEEQITLFIKTNHLDDRWSTRWI